MITNLTKLIFKPIYILSKYIFCVYTKYFRKYCFVHVTLPSSTSSKPTQRKNFLCTLAQFSNLTLVGTSLKNYTNPIYTSFIHIDLFYTSISFESTSVNYALICIYQPYQTAICIHQLSTSI